MSVRAGDRAATPARQPRRRLADLRERPELIYEPATHYSLTDRRELLLYAVLQPDDEVTVPADLDHLDEVRAPLVDGSVSTITGRG